MSRRWYVFLGAACALVVGGMSAGLVLAFSGTSAAAPPTKQQYFAKVAAICRYYGPKLDKIPPPIDVVIVSEIIQSVRKVEPLLRAEAEAVRRLTPPRALRAQLARWNKLNYASIAELGKSLREAKKMNFQGVQGAYVAFVVKGAKAQKLGHSIGFPSPPC